MFLLDTNACIQILNNSSPSLVAHLRACAVSDIYLCSVVKAELLYGAYHSTRVAENLRTLERFFATFQSLAFDDTCVHHFGQIRHELARAGTPIGPYDLMIAAIALTHDLTLVATNTAEFARIPGLRLENWEIDAV